MPRRVISVKCAKAGAERHESQAQREVGPLGAEGRASLGRPVPRGQQSPRRVAGVDTQGVSGGGRYPGVSGTQERAVGVCTEGRAAGGGSH